MSNAVLVVVSALISGLLATVVTLYLQHRERVLTEKRRVFSILVSSRYRYDISVEENVRAINSIDVIFYKDKSVRAALVAFFDEADKQAPGSNIFDKYLKLLEEMAKAVKYTDIHWDRLKRWYYPKGLGEKINQENAIREAQFKSAQATLQSR